MTVNGPPVSAGLFAEFERRVDGELGRLSREIESLRDQIGERRNRSWNLGMVILAGIVLPILGAVIAALVQSGT